MLKTIGYLRFLLAITLMVGGFLFVAFYIGGTANSYNGSFNAGDGFSSIGNLFGGLGSVAIALVAFGVLSLTILGIYSLAKAGKPVLFAMCTLALIVICAIVGLNWIHPSWNMLTPLLALAFVVPLTWGVVRITHKK